MSEREIKSLAENLSTWIDLNYDTISRIEINKFWGFNSEDKTLLKELFFVMLWNQIDYTLEHTALEVVEINITKVQERYRSSFNTNVERVLSRLTKCKALLS